MSEETFLLSNKILRTLQNQNLKRPFCSTSSVSIGSKYFKGSCSGANYSILFLKKSRILYRQVCTLYTILPKNVQ